MKRPTKSEQRARDLVKRLNALREKLGHGATETFAAEMRVPRETVSRWLNYAITPRGLSVVAIERYLEKMDA